MLEAARRRVPVSIDTAKAEVARRAIELGAELVNDVTALRGDPDLAEVVASSGAYLCLMHMQGEPRTMQDSPTYDDVAAEVASFLEQRLAFAVDAGIPEERICLDPGFGFGKTVEQNFELLGRLGEIVALGRPVLVGLSRKRSLGRILGDPDATTGPLLREPRGRRRSLRPRRRHLPRPRRPRARGSADRRGGRPEMILELEGLAIFGRHGVLEEERRDGQEFLYDIRMDVGDAGASDRIEDAVDYREVADCVREVSASRDFNLIEALATGGRRCARRALPGALGARPGDEDESRRRRRPPRDRQCRAGFFALTIEAESR